MTAPTGMLFADPQVKPLSTLGAPQAGCYYCFFLTGTTTPSNVYADGFLATPLSQPTPGAVNPTGGTVSNAAGLFVPIYLNPAVVYRAQLYSAAGIKLEDTDPYVPPVSEAAALAAVLADITSSFVGGLIYPQTWQEIAASVTPTNYSYPAGTPERYIAAGFVYSGSTGTNTDFSTAIQTALNIAGQPCILGPNNYRCNVSLTIPNNQKLIGQGLNETAIVYPSTVTGNMLNYNGSNAAKIEIRGISFYGNAGAGLTGGLILGTNAAPYGTEGYIDQVMVRDLPANAKAYDIYANIGEFGNIYALNTAGIRIQGNFQITAIENTNASGFTDVNSNQSCTQLQDGWVGFFECEAPQTGLFLLTVQGQLEIDYWLPSLAASTTFTELVYLTSSATGWKINMPQIYFGGSSGTFPTYTNVFYDQGAAVPFGGGSTSTSSTTHAGAGLYQSGIMTQGNQFAVKKQQLTNFSLTVVNTAGTLQHKICAPGQSVAGTWVATISGASSTLTNTPTGTDASTAFAAGGKISSADNYLFVLNSGVEVPADIILSAAITSNNTSTAYLIRPTIISLDINGVTQNWLAFQLVGLNSGSNISWATALGSSTNAIEVTFLGFVK